MMRRFLVHITIIIFLSELVHSRTSVVELNKVLRHKRNANYRTIQPVDEAIYETINYMKTVGGINIIAQSGTFEINFPNGKALKVQYQADEKGYVVKKQQYQSSVDMLSTKSLQTKTPPSEDLTLSRLANDIIREAPLTSKDLTEQPLSTLTPLPSNGTIIFPTPLPDIDNRVPIISNIAIGSLVG